MLFGILKCQSIHTITTLWLRGSECKKNEKEEKCIKRNYGRKKNDRKESESWITDDLLKLI